MEYQPQTGEMGKPTSSRTSPYTNITNRLSTIMKGPFPWVGVLFVIGLSSFLASNCLIGNSETYSNKMATSSSSSSEALGAKAIYPTDWIVSPWRISDIGFYQLSRLVQFLYACFGISSSSHESPVSSVFWPFLWSVSPPSPEMFARLSPSTPSIEMLKEDAALLSPVLDRLKLRTFFRIFNVDLDKPCPFWAAAGMCSVKGGCSVCQCGEDQIPKVWRMRPIEEFVNKKHAIPFTPWDRGISKTTKLFQPFMVVSDEMKGPKASYVDLSLNPPGFTAYKGGPIWDRIYHENCMRLTNPLGGVSVPAGCQEEKTFFKIVSGLHSNIAALSSEHYFTAERGSHRYNMEFFRDKLGEHPDRIGNLFMTFSVLLRTVCEVAPVLQECSCEAGSTAEDLAARADLLQLLNQTYWSCDSKYTQSALFERRASDVIQQFQNITQILDCVECEKCRLHGKLKMTALQVALRASASDTFVQSLERNEVTALINALAYFTESVQIIGRFEIRLWWMRFFVCLRVMIAMILLYILTRCLLKAKQKQQPPHSPPLMQTFQDVPCKIN